MLHSRKFRQALGDGMKGYFQILRYFNPQTIVTRQYFTKFGNDDIGLLFFKPAVEGFCISLMEDKRFHKVFFGL